MLMVVQWLIHKTNWIHLDDTSIPHPNVFKLQAVGFAARTILRRSGVVYGKKRIRAFWPAFIQTHQAPAGWTSGIFYF